MVFANILAQEDLGEQHTCPDNNVETECDMQSHSEPVSSTLRNQTVVECDQRVCDERAGQHIT